MRENASVTPLKSIEAKNVYRPAWQCFLHYASKALAPRGDLCTLLSEDYLSFFQHGSESSPVDATLRACRCVAISKNISDFVTRLAVASDLYKEIP
jgi:hypothetical protein